MKRYEVSNTMSGLVLGIFEGEDEEGAIAAMLRDAGYARPEDCPCDGADEVVAVEVEVCRACGKKLDPNSLIDDDICFACATERVVDSARKLCTYEGPHSLIWRIRNEWDGHGWTGDESAETIAANEWERMLDDADDAASEDATEDEEV